MAMMFPEGNDKSFLTESDERNIDAFWSYAALSAHDVSEGFIALVKAENKDEESKLSIIKDFALYLIISAIHRLSQHFDGDKYFAVMLETLESVSFTCFYDMFQARFKERGYGDVQCKVLAMISGIYVLANNDYIRKATEMHNYGFFEKMKIQFALQNRGKGLTLNVGDYTVGYALLGSYFVRNELNRYVGGVPEAKLKEVYRLVAASFNFYYENLVGKAFSQNPQIADLLMREMEPPVPGQKSAVATFFSTWGHIVLGV